MVTVWSGLRAAHNQAGAKQEIFNLRQNEIDDAHARFKLSYFGLEPRVYQKHDEIVNICKCKCVSVRNNVL